jgi:hypothetical protein
MLRRVSLVVGVMIIVGVSAAVALLAWDSGMPGAAIGRAVSATAIPLAVLGDSNSHSYQDRLNFPAGSGQRGGAHQDRTFQWTEVLARLRGQEFDVGPWVAWGRSGIMIRVLDGLGLPVGRAPRKEDYLYNFAVSSMVCEQLMHGKFRQAPRLVALMDKEPERWKNGVVVVRMGLGDWSPLLEALARNPDAPELQPVLQRCLGNIGDTIRLIHQAHSSTRIVVVGVVNEASDPMYLKRWQTAAEWGNLVTALGTFNTALRQLVQSQPRTIFFDDEAWMLERWGSRDADGKPAYKTVTIGGTLQVTNTTGDAPTNTMLRDHHAGLAYNALWAQSLVARLKEGFGLPLTPIGDDELARFVLPLAEASLRAPGS